MVVALMVLIKFLFTTIWKTIAFLKPYSVYIYTYFKILYSRKDKDWIRFLLLSWGTYAYHICAFKLLGSVENRTKFNWKARRKVSLGIALAVAYIHEEIKPHIVHRDIKASNILLDQHFNPKLSDFGLSKLIPDNNTHISTRVAGTL